MIIFTLHRYIFRELFRVFVLSTAALTLMLTLGSVLRPIQKYGVGPEQTLHLLGYFVPITLTFVLPMGALFATALVYGRFASDNELDACRASGINLTTLIYPSICLSIIVAIVTLILSFHVVPAFVHRAERAIKANAKQILFRNIQRKGFYELPGARFRIKADHAISEEDMLTGVTILETESGNFKKLITARNAKIIIEKAAKQGYRRSNKITVVAQDAYQIEDYGQAYSKYLPISDNFEMLLSDNIKFQKIDQIKKIKADMMEFGPVYRLAVEIRGGLAIEMLAEDIATSANDTENKYYQLSIDDKIVMLSCAGSVAKEGKKIKLSAPITLLEIDNIRQELICRWDSNEGFIEFQDSDIDSKLVMVLESPRWAKSDTLKGLARRHVVKNLPLPQNISTQLTEEKLLTAIDSIESLVSEPSPHLISRQHGMHRKIKSTLNEITAETHSRLVLGLGCITLLLIGCSLGIMFKGGHLLKNPSTPTITGVIVMWAGLAILTVLAVILYRKLTKT